MIPRHGTLSDRKKLARIFQSAALFFVAFGVAFGAVSGILPGSEFSAHAFSSSRKKSKLAEIRENTLKKSAQSRSPASIITNGITTGITTDSQDSRSLAQNYLDPVLTNVIVVTIDGARWQEVFRGVDEKLDDHDFAPIFSWLRGKGNTEGFLWGDPRRREEVVVANKSWSSLPAYQSIFAGAVQVCKSNACGRTKAHTLQERLTDSTDSQGAGFTHANVATIASWEKIALAVEHDEHSSFVNAGNEPLFDGEIDEELKLINEQQKKDPPPWGGSRKDKYTFQHALRYLKVHEPRFLYISFVDADEWGHRGNYPEYVKSLRFYDEALRTLAQVVDAMKDYGESTTILVTTDHGRGSDSDWGEHGSGFPGSEKVWIYGRNALTSQEKIARSHPSRKITHLDIRPTVEALFGLKPEGPGKVISELLP